MDRRALVREGHLSPLERLIPVATPNQPARVWDGEIGLASP